MRRIYFQIIFALVWCVNGFFCKVLDWVPRHQEIVARILGGAHARELTVAIGCGEVLLGIWILSGWKWRWSVTVQVLGVLVMNVIEYVLARELLLFGGWNGLIALAFCSVVLYSGRQRVTSKNHERTSTM